MPATAASGPTVPMDLAEAGASLLTIPLAAMAAAELDLRRAAMVVHQTKQWQQWWYIKPSKMFSKTLTLPTVSRAVVLHVRQRLRFYLALASRFTAFASQFARSQRLRVGVCRAGQN